MREARFNSQHCLRKRAYLTSPGMADMIAEEGGGWRGKRREKGGRGGNPLDEKDGTLWMEEGLEQKQGLEVLCSQSSSLVG